MYVFTKTSSINLMVDVFLTGQDARKMCVDAADAAIERRG